MVSSLLSFTGAIVVTPEMAALHHALTAATARQISDDLSTSTIGSGSVYSEPNP
jgi:hypothetical protein